MNKREAAIQALITLFEHTSYRDQLDTAFVWVDSPCEYGDRWGSFKHIKREWLCGRDYGIGVSGTYPQSIHISLRDTVYDPKTYSSDLPLNPRGLT